MDEQEELTPQEKWQRLKPLIRAWIGEISQQLRHSREETRQITKAIMDYYFGGIENE